MSRVIEKRKNLFRFIFLSFSVTIIISSFFIILAMIFYPGGNFSDYNMEGYRFLYNGLCDMRDPVALNGEPNILSSSLLKIGMIFFSIATMTFFCALCFFFQKRKITKYLSIIGTILGIIQGPFFILIIFLHTTYELHMFSNVFAPLLLYITVILYTIIFFVDKSFPKLNLYSFLILAISSIVLSILVGIATNIGGNFHFMTNRLGPNLFNFLTSIIYIIQGISLYSFLSKPNQELVTAT